MPLSQQIANLLYSGSYSLNIDNETELNVGIEVDAVRAIAANGYVNLSWSARFALSAATLVRGRYDSFMSKGLPALGWYEICYGLTVMSRYPIDDFIVGTPKVTGVYDGSTLNSPGSTYVAGNGATVSSVNIGSDRPYRGDVIRYYLAPGVTGTLFLAVNTGFVDNPTDSNKYIIHP